MKYLKIFEEYNDNDDFTQEPISGVSAGSINMHYQTAEDLAYTYNHKDTGYTKISMSADNGTGASGGYSERYLTIQDNKTGKYYQTWLQEMEYDETQWELEGENNDQVIFYEVQKKEKVVTYYGNVLAESNIFEKKDLIDFSQEPISGEPDKDHIDIPVDIMNSFIAYNPDYAYARNIQEQGKEKGGYRKISNEIIRQDIDESGWIECRLILQDVKTGNYYCVSYTEERNQAEWDNYADITETEVRLTEVHQKQKLVTYYEKKCLKELKNLNKKSYQDNQIEKLSNYQ